MGGMKRGWEDGKSFFFNTTRSKSFMSGHLLQSLKGFAVKLQSATRRYRLNVG